MEVVTEETGNLPVSKVTAECATLSASQHGAEGQMVNKERWEAIRRLHEAGQSISAIARELDIDRKTVRYWLRRSAWTPYRREAVVATLLAEHQRWLEQRAPEVNFSARVLFQELQGTRAFSGSYDTVKNAVRPLRAQANMARLTQRRFETGPGEQAQVDWGVVKVRFDGGQSTSIHFFVMTLGYSRRAYVEAYADERMDSLFAAHERAFAHFGGCCAELLYDRMRTVVSGSENGRPKWNARFEAFADYWGFKPRACQPYRAQTKGKVESGVKYVKRNFIPGRSFRDLEDVNEQLRAWTAQVADVRVHGTTHQRPIDRFADEAAQLRDTRQQPSFLDAVVRERVVAEDWLVTIDSNRYSVPCRLIGKIVQVVRVGARWQFSYAGQLVAEHAILAGRHQLSVIPEHGPGAAARNSRQRFSAPAEAPRLQVVETVEVRDLAVYEQMLEVA